MPIVAMLKCLFVSNYTLGEIAYSFVLLGLILCLIQLLQNYYFNTIRIGELLYKFSYTSSLYESSFQKIRCKC